MSTTTTVLDEQTLLARVQAPEGEGREILDAATREVIGRVPVQSADDLDAAVARAKAAQPGWEALGHEERSRLLVAAADAIDANAEPLARLLSREQGKPLNGPNARFEVGACSAWLRANAATVLEPQVPRGKVLGGSHALNAMIWVRCAPHDFDHWASLGNDGWAWADVLPVYKAIEDYSGGESELRGSGGILPVTADYALAPIQQSIIDAAVEEELEHNPDYKGDHLDGVSQEQVTMQGGRRANTWTTYLKPVRDRVDVRTGCHVHSVIVEGAPPSAPG